MLNLENRSGELAPVTFYRNVLHQQPKRSNLKHALLVEVTEQFVC